MKIPSFIFPLLGSRLSPVPEKISLTPSFVTSLAPHPSQLKNVTVVFLPGSLIEPEEYTPLLQDLKYTCSLKLVNANIVTAKFTGNILHRFEVDLISDDIKSNTNPDDDLFIIGHSSGAFVGFDIAKKLNATGVVSVCGTFNSLGDLPWDSIDSHSYPIPSLTVLAEHDKLLPFSLAVTEYCSDTYTDDLVYSTVLNKQGHLSFVGDNPESIGLLSWKVSEFITSLSTDGERSESAKQYLKDETKNIARDFGGLLTPNRADVSSLVEKLTGSKDDHHSVPPDMLSTFFYIAFHGVRPLMHWYWLLPMFVVSQPGSHESHSYSPLPDLLPIATLHMSPIWIKVDSLKVGKNRAMEMNKSVFEEALSSVTQKQRDSYETNGKKMTFDNDFSVPKLPGCSVAWLMIPLFLDNSGSTLVVTSPTIDIGSRMNAKILSKRMCIEWITTKAFQ